MQEPAGRGEEGDEEAPMLRAIEKSRICDYCDGLDPPDPGLGQHHANEFCSVNLL